MRPFVRHLLICDDVRPSPTNPRRRNVYGLIHSVRPRAGVDYPVRLSFCVYSVLSSGRGRGTLRVSV